MPCRQTPTGLVPSPLVFLEWYKLTSVVQWVALHQDGSFIALCTSSHSLWTQLHCPRGTSGPYCSLGCCRPCDTSGLDPVPSCCCLHLKKNYSTTNLNSQTSLYWACPIISQLWPRQKQVPQHHVLTRDWEVRTKWSLRSTSTPGILRFYKHCPNSYSKFQFRHDARWMQRSSTAS